MKAENFCFWLQGFFELTDPNAITPEQAEQIKTHLALVFKHDPAMAHAPPKRQPRGEPQSLVDAIDAHEHEKHHRRPLLFC